MLVDIRENKELINLHNRTGKPVDDLVNDILEIHLDSERKNNFIKNELDVLFRIYKENNNLHD